MDSKEKVWGLLAEYESAADIYDACKKVRNAGYKKWDACTPFPVHGIEKAMGLKNSVLPWMVLVAGVTGCVLMTIFMVWINVYDYPLNIAGKPKLSLPAFVPPAFEITILFSALTAVFGMFFLNRLPTFHHPVFNSKRFERVTNDKFFIVIESADSRFDAEKTAELLKSTGAHAIEVLETAS